MMKRIYYLMMCLCLVTVLKAEDNIALLRKLGIKEPQERSIVQLPTATLDNGTIQVSFPYACTFVITITEVVNESNVITETSATPKGTVTLDVSNLKAGKTYCIIIYTEGTEYYGYFEL